MPQMSVVRSAGACPTVHQTAAYDVARGPAPRDLNCLNQDLQDLQDYLPRNEHFFATDASSGPLGPACL